MVGSSKHGKILRNCVVVTKMISSLATASRIMSVENGYPSWVVLRTALRH